MATTPIVQFGTSRFLQAHADLFISEALSAGSALGRIAVVQSSGDASRSHRLRALEDPAGFEIQIKGMERGGLVNMTKRVTSIARGFSLPDDVEAVAGIISGEAEIILSNTADAGYRAQDADRSTEFSSLMSYPAKLAWFLFRRFEAGGAPIQIMPAELVPNNGAVLRGLVLKIAENYPGGFSTWLESDVRWVNSLVDRIVSEALEPAGAVAEPYALWAIENQPDLVLPCEHPCVSVVTDLEQVEALKLFILNLGHTYLVSRWLSAGKAPHQYVREVMEDPDYLEDLRDLYEQEVLPGFAAHGRRSEAEAYILTTIDRFRNPFLDHKLADIAQNHQEKIERRIASFLTWAREADPGLRMARLEKVV